MYDPNASKADLNFNSVTVPKQPPQQLFRVEFRRSYRDGTRDLLPKPGEPMTEPTKPQAVVLVAPDLDDAYEAIDGLVVGTTTEDGREVSAVEIVNIGTLQSPPVYLAAA